MKILLLGGNKYNTGTFFRAREFARWLTKFGHAVTLAYNGPSWFSPVISSEEGSIELGIPCVLDRINLDTAASPYGVFWMKRYIDRQRFDLVHGFEYYPVVHKSACHARDTLSIPYVSDWADWFSLAFFRKLFRLPYYRDFLNYKEKEVRRQASGVTAISKLLQAESCRLGKAEKEVLYLPGGAPVDRLIPLELHSCKKKIGFAPGTFVFGYLGAFLVHELIPFLEAFKRLPPMKNVKFMVMGRKNAAVARFIADNGLAERVCQTGYIAEEELNTYLGACDSLVLPMNDSQYNHHRWPNKIGDYMATGRPLIASAVGEVLSVFARGEVGWQVSGELESISAAMQECLEDEPARTARGQAARMLAENEYSWEHLTRRLESFYRSFS